MNDKLKRCTILCSLSATFMLAGCSLGGDMGKLESKKTTLKVFYSDEQQFLDRFGKPYSVLHPDIEFEVVSFPSDSDPSANRLESTEKFVSEHQPDILYVDSELLTQFGNEGKLLELDTMVEDKSFDKDTLIPGLIENARELGGGKIYGLAPSFYSEVLYYNKDLFTKYGVDFPTDGMSWESLLRLAERFPADGDKRSRIYGLSFSYMNSIFNLADRIGTTNNLSYIAPSADEVTIDSEDWRKTFELAMTAKNKGSIYGLEPVEGGKSFRSYEEGLLEEPFFAGKAAMRIDSNILYDIFLAQRFAPEKAIRNWDMVSMPVNPRSPTDSPFSGLGQHFAISSQTVNAEAARSFLRYVTSDDYAKLTTKMRHNKGFLPVRASYFQNDKDHRLQAFYALKPRAVSTNKAFAKLTPEFLMQLPSMVRQELEPAFEGKITLKEALKNAQTRGQADLLQSKSEQKEMDASATAGS